MTKPRFGFALEYVTDIEAAKRFYVDVLGLEMERYHPTYIQFSNFAIASDESMSGTREPELYWLVDDADAAYRELSRKSRRQLAAEADAVREGVRDQGPCRPAPLPARAGARPAQPPRVIDDR